MIWHFFEVWALMLVAFAIGCPLGAVAYRLIAASPLADLQGGLADAVGDIVDNVKGRFGIGPVWRPELHRVVERHAADEAGEYGGPRAVGAARPIRVLPPAGVPMIADASDRRDDEGEGGHMLAEPLAIAAPVVAGERGGGEDLVMARPVALAAPRNSVPDDLQRIRGVGRRIERRLNALGIYHFGQIAAWTPAEMRWVAQRLAFPDRIEWDDWIGQAIILAAGGDTGFVKSADRRRALRRQKALERAIERATEADDTADFTGETALGEEFPGDDELVAEEMSAEGAELDQEAELAREAGLPQDEIPEDATPKDATAEDATVEDATPEDATVEDATPEEDIPEEDIPEDESPEEHGAPEDHKPDADVAPQEDETEAEDKKS